MLIHIFDKTRGGIMLSASLQKITNLNNSQEGNREGNGRIFF
jgi:hypothetical protein